jgi:CheY-like chemotaxis protein
VRVEVIDTGAGIAPDVLPHIFDAFEQGGNDVTRTFGGLGLGLAISAALADAHGGILTAASDGLGLGARFTLELDALEVLPIAPPPAETKPPRARRLRLLLVEDHPDTSRVMTRLLRSLDHDVHAVGDVRAALRTAERQRFDLVISDIGLPDGSGLELMRQLRERYQLKGIALSGYGREDDMRRSREAGFDAHVTKPIDFDSLAAAIADVAA